MHRNVSCTLMKLLTKARQPEPSLAGTTCLWH